MHWPKNYGNILTMNVYKAAYISTLSDLSSIEKALTILIDKAELDSLSLFRISRKLYCIRLQCKNKSRPTIIKALKKQLDIKSTVITTEKSFM